MEADSRRRRRRRTIRWLLAGGALAVVAVLAGAFLGRDRPYDADFDTRVAEPAHTAARPVVLYDEGHRNTHPADAAYRPFVDLVRADGHEVRVAREAISEEALAGVAVLVVALPRGANDANDEPAFPDAETAAIERWVRGGGSLLLVTDHWPYGPAAASLAGRFGVTMGHGLVEDPAHGDPERGASHLVFDRANGLVRDHPITRGRGAAEEVRRVLTFTGQSLAGPPGSTALLALADGAVEYPPTAPRVDRDGGDVRVSMEYGDPFPAAGRAQALALEHGTGRVVVLADAGMLRAQRPRGGPPVGMNVAGYDNRQLAINVMRWLSRAL